MMAMDEDIQRFEAMSKEDVLDSLEEIVDTLVSLYDMSPEHGFRTGYAPVAALGEVLHKAGGFELMLQVHAMFRARRMFYARNLEIVWDGVGYWHG